MKTKPLTKNEIRTIAATRGYEARYSGKTGTWYFHKDGREISAFMPLDESKILRLGLLR